MGELMDFFVWGTTMILGIIGCIFVTQLSPSQTYAKYATITFLAANAGYWLYIYWSQEVSKHLIYSSVASLVMILPVVLVTKFMSSKD
jgi:hypothetical protein